MKQVLLRFGRRAPAVALLAIGAIAAPTLTTVGSAANRSSEGVITVSPEGKLQCNGKDATIVNPENPKKPIKGTSGPDVIVGGPSRDEIYGFGGDDTICGGGARDRIFGGAGDDTIFGDGGPDRIEGGLGADDIFGGRGEDRLRGGDGDDEIFGEQDDDELRGDEGDDSLDGGSGQDGCADDNLEKTKVTSCGEDEDND